MSSQMPELVEHVVAKDAASIHDYVLDGTKVGWYADRIAAWQRGEKIAPVTIDVAWTRQCNAACSFCYAQLQANEGDTITKQNAFDFLEDAAAIGVKGVSLISDGESTVVPWYADSIEHGAKCGLAIGVGSNGIKLTRPVLERILPHLSYLRFNFSAGEQKRYAEIMGVRQHFFGVVVQNIRDAMDIVRRDKLPVTVNMQLVLDPKDGDQILPFARMAKELRPTYAIIKHCSDGFNGELGVDYSKYAALHDALHAAEALSDADLRITAKWDKIRDAGKRHYTACMGAPFIMQISGSGLVAPCGMLFNERFKAFHIGSICRERFKDIWASERYTEVMNYLASEHFNPQERCGSMCLQHSTNKFVFDYVKGVKSLPTTAAPPHMEFL